MSENQNVLKVTIQFNKKKVNFSEVGETALPTYQELLDVFKNPTDSKKKDEIELSSEITDYA